MPLAGTIIPKFDDVPIGIGTTLDPTGQSVTPSSSANTKGSYVQFVAATAAQTRMMLIQWLYNPAQATPALAGLFDIATGGSGSETVLIPNIGYGVPFQFYSITGRLLLPVTIPAGTRIAARCQHNIASSTDTLNLSIALFPYGPGGNGVDSLNISTSTSIGTALTPANNSYTSYTQLIASTARAYKGIFLIHDCQATGGSNFATNWLDIAIGAAASEVNFITALPYNNFQGGSNWNCTPYIPYPIPAGSRISVRTYGGSTSDTDGWSAYGVF